MVESDVATFIAGEAGLTKGTNLFLSELPLETREGVAVRILRERKKFAVMYEGNLVVMVFKMSYPAARDLSTTISTALNERRGTLDASWTVRDEVEMQNYGKDGLDRYTFVVTCPISYKE